jgi:hypothetical protein
MGGLLAPQIRDAALRRALEALAPGLEPLSLEGRSVNYWLCRTVDALPKYLRRNPGLTKAKAQDALSA